MADVIEELEQLGGQVTDKGIQLADTLRPTAIDILSGNPHTLAEWLIYIICLPITLPLTFMVAAIRWLLVEAPFIEKEILKLVGIGRTTGLGDICVQCGLNDIPFFGPLVEALINPSNEFDLGIMEAAASGTVMTGLGVVTDPLFRPIGYCMNRGTLNKLVSAEQAAILDHKGLISSDVRGYL